jgi:hypothetical protein
MPFFHDRTCPCPVCREQLRQTLRPRRIPAPRYRTCDLCGDLVEVLPGQPSPCPTCEAAQQRAAKVSFRPVDVQAPAVDAADLHRWADDGGQCHA